MWFVDNSNSILDAFELDFYRQKVETEYGSVVL